MGNCCYFMYLMLVCVVVLFVVVFFVIVVYVVGELLCVVIDVIFVLMEFVENGKCIGFDVDLIEVLVCIMGC